MSVFDSVVIWGRGATKGYAQFTLGYVVGVLDNGMPKLRFGYTAEVTVDRRLRASGPEPIEVTVSQGSIGSTSVADGRLRAGAFEAAIKVGAAIEKYLEFEGHDDIEALYEWVVEGGHFLEFEVC